MSLTVTHGKLRRPERVDHGREAVMLPKEISGQCKNLVRRIFRALPRKGPPGDTFDRCAALAIALCSETGCISDPMDREEFVGATINALRELVPATVTANAKQDTRV
jgi:hypothetical protein